MLGAVSAGADDCVVKPCEPASLLFKVAHLLSHGGSKRGGC
jgi:DNA-binding response OmpR family regulator